MLVDIDTLKEFLGLPLTDDAAIDPILERSSVLSQTLVDSYVGYTLEQMPENKKTYTVHYLRGVTHVRLPVYPAKVTSVKIDTVEAAMDTYRADARLGMVSFPEQQTYIGRLDVQYIPGFTPDTLPLDIQMAMVNIALTLYENGGKMPMQTGTTGALKSLTMFDAMSMSFDTDGSASGAAGTPEGLVKQWAFVLDKYRADQFVMGS